MGAGITRLSGWGQVSSWFDQVEKVVDKMAVNEMSWHHWPYSQHFFSLQLTNGPSKRECLSVARLSSQV